MATLRDTQINGNLTVSGKISGGFWDVGDTLSEFIYCAGYVTDSGTTINFSIPFAPFTNNVTGMNFTTLSMTVRQNGNYLVGSSSGRENILTSSTINMSYTLYTSTVRIVLVSNSAYTDVTNNDTVGIVCSYTATLI